MIQLFLSRNVPDDDELLVGWWDDEAQESSPASSDLARGPGVRGAGARADRHRRHDARSTPPDGPAAGDRAAGARTAPTAGALVVVTFLDETRERPVRHDADLHDRVAAGAVHDHRPRLRGSPAGCCAPLRTLRETAEEISETDLARRLPETGNDDITALTRTFNGMLARLEAAFVGPAAVPRRRRPRAEDPADRAARPPRAARPRRPGRGGRRPGPCCSTRSTGCPGSSAT